MAQAVAPFVKEKARRLFEVQDIEVTTKSVEKMLSPLIKQVHHCKHTCMYAWSSSCTLIDDIVA